MRIAALADIHGNLEALDVVVADIRSDPPDMVVCLGDIVGYGASPAECCAIAKEFADTNILGNHDAAVAGILDTGYFNDDAKRSILWTRGVLSDAHLSWLRGLPYTATHDDVLFSHGSPVDPGAFDYVMYAVDVQRVFLMLGDRYRVFLMGHSHRRFVVSRGMDPDDAILVYYADTVPIDRERRYIISVGSVGQPRDRDTTASYGILDTDKGTYSVKRLKYAIRLAGDKILKAGLPEWLAYRLTIGV